MKTGKKYPDWRFYDIVVIVITWLAAIALAYTVMIKLSIIIK